MWLSPGQRDEGRTDGDYFQAWNTLHWWLSGKETHLLMQESQEIRVWSLGLKDPLVKEMATHPSILAWKIPWSEEPGGQQSTVVAKSWTGLSTHALPSLIPKNSSAVLSFLLSHPLPGWNKHPGPRGGASDEREAWVHESLEEGIRSEQKEHKMLLHEWRINFYCIKAVWELFVMVVCLPCEVGCLLKKSSFLSLSHHEWTTHLHFSDGWFGLRDVNRQEVTWYALIHTSVILHSLTQQPSCSFLITLRTSSS